MMDFMLKKTGQKKVLEPYEIGKVATFLCGGGRCITGMSINADGGIHLGQKYLHMKHKYIFWNKYDYP